MGCYGDNGGSSLNTGSIDLCSDGFMTSERRRVSDRIKCYFLIKTASVHSFKFFICIPF